MRIKYPRDILTNIVIKSKIFKGLSDKNYIKLLWYIRHGYRLRTKSPETFQEKIQWLKLYDHHPEYYRLVDKYEAKEYVTDLLGSEYIIRTLGIWDSVSDIPFDALPNKFVLKTTHGGGNQGVIICKDKQNFNITAAKKRLNQALKQDIYSERREWAYKNLKPRILAEEFMEDKTSGELIDYKFFCFNGVPSFCQVIKNRRTKETIDFFDMKWKHQEFIGLNPNASSATDTIPPPNNLTDMIRIASLLSDGKPFLRVDLYEINNQIYFGEMTFYPASGFGTFKPDVWNKILGDMIPIQ